MCTHLSKRGATYYFRRVIPENVRPWFGNRAEWVYSLSTKDRDEAKRRVARETVKTDDAIAQVARRVAAGERPAGATEPASAAYLERTEAELAREAVETREAEAREQRWLDREPFRKEIEAKFKRSTTAQLTRTEAAMRDMLREQAYETAIANDRAMIAKAELAERAVGTPLAPLTATAPPAVEPVGVMLDGEIIDLWAAERKPTKKSIDAHRAAARWLYEYTERKPVRSITRKDLLSYKAKLLDAGQTAANIKMKLSRIRTLSKWAYDNDQADTNFADGVRIIDSEAAANRRREFDLASLRAIFGSPVYAEGLRPTQGRGEAAYWLPLLGLFTGARLEELGQLRTSDVAEMAYPDSNGDECSAWVIRVTSDTNDGLTIKNAMSERIIPIHPELVRLGFLQFVKGLQVAKHTRLFHELKPNGYGTVTAKWGEWFGRYKREVCGVTDRRMVFHSFRHTFKHYARHTGMHEGVSRQIMGHSSGDVADAYGSGHSLHNVVEGMKLFRVPGLLL